MSRIISDFIKSADTAAGFGYFEGKPDASNYSRAMGKSQKRKYKRYGIIPRAFFDYLKATNAIDPHAVITISSQTIDGLLDLLWETPERNDADRSEGECLRAELLKEKYPELRNKMGSAQALWKKLEDQKRLFSKKRNESIETGQNMTAT